MASGSSSVAKRTKKKKKGGESSLPSSSQPEPSSAVEGTPVAVDEAARKIREKTESALARLALFPRTGEGSLFDNCGEGNEELIDLLCCSCFDVPFDTVLMPCECKCLCVSCAETLMAREKEPECPVCMLKVKAVEKM